MMFGRVRERRANVNYIAPFESLLRKANTNPKTTKKKKNTLFTSSIPTLKPSLHKKCNVSLPPATVFLAALQMLCKKY